MAFEKIKLADNIVIKWNPVTDDGQVRLDFRDFVKDATGNATSFSDPESTEVHFDPIMTLAQRIASVDYTDPFTGTVLPTQISGAAVMECIKRLVDVVILESEEQKALALLTSSVSIDQATNATTVSIAGSQYVEGDEFVSMTIDWGDGSLEDTVTTGTTATHTYAEVVDPTEYVIGITVKTTNHAALSMSQIVLVEPPVAEPSPAV